MNRIANWKRSIEAWEKLQQELIPTLEYMSPKKTWEDYSSDVPFYFAFYLSYPFVWLAFWLWEGIMQAKEEVWGKL